MEHYLHDLQALQFSLIPLLGDNKVALHITCNLVLHEHTKHMKLIIIFVRDEFKVLRIALLTSTLMLSLLLFIKVSIQSPNSIFTEQVRHLQFICSDLKGLLSILVMVLS